jgi:hypothetical protein
MGLYLKKELGYPADTASQLVSSSSSSSSSSRLDGQKLCISAVTLRQAFWFNGGSSAQQWQECKVRLLLVESTSSSSGSENADSV